MAEPEQPGFWDAEEAEAAAGPVPGEIRGDVTDEEIRSVTDRLEVWCGSRQGWRQYGTILNPAKATVIMHEHRLRAALVFDLGAAKLLRGDGADPEQEEQG